jgi:hypothetical protein
MAKKPKPGRTPKGRSEQGAPPEQARKVGRPPAGGRRPAYTLYVRIDPALGAAFERYVEETKPKPTQTSAVELALEKLLTEAGYWPPPDASEK